MLPRRILISRLVPQHFSPSLRAISSTPLNLSPDSSKKKCDSSADLANSVENDGPKKISWPISFLGGRKLMGGGLGIPALFGELIFWWYQARAPINRINPIVDLTKQTRVLPDGSRICNYLKSDNLMARSFPNVKTLPELLRHGVKASAGGPMIGDRVKQVDGSEPYVWQTYSEVIRKSTDLAYAFRELGLGDGEGHRIAVFMRNRSEWVITEQAAYLFSNVIVPLYETLGPTATSFILNQCETEMVMCDNLQKAYKILDERANCPALKFVCVCDGDNVSPADRKAFHAEKLKLYTFEELLEKGKNTMNKIEFKLPTPSTTATICYTSGTTGTPKGVMLTHGNIIADCTTVNYVERFVVGKDEIVFSFLPMAHMYERVVQNMIYLHGGRVGFYRGRLPDLLDDIQTLKPTVMPCVPRVLNRVYDRVVTEVNKSVVKKFIFNVALNYKLRELNVGVCRNNSIFDRIVFNKVRNILGGRLHLLITGSAPISADVLNFFRAVFGAHVLEGYGQTECVAAASTTMAGETKSGHVGVPIPCSAIKLIDVPELNYFAKDGKGEICVRGYNVSPGYFKNEEETKNVFSEDGWLKTGDIGCWEPEGTLKIIDRKKHIFKLAQGEYIAPEKIENVYVCSKYVHQSFVHGESFKAQLVAVIHPDEEVLYKMAQKELKLEGLTIDELCQRSDVKFLIMNDLKKVAKTGGLHSFEQVKDIYLTPEAFTLENGQLTATLKSKRPELLNFYAKEIEDMYINLEGQ